MIRLRNRAPRQPDTPLRLHAEPTDDPASVRWVVPPGRVRGAGVVTADNIAAALLPAGISQLLETGELRRVHLETEVVVCVRSETAAWPDLAPRINEALFSHLSAGGVLAGGTPQCDDASLAHGVAAVLAGEVSNYAASHGGGITLAQVRDGVVTLQLSGACRGCPAAQSTITNGIAAKLAPELPAITGFRVID